MLPDLKLAYKLASFCDFSYDDEETIRNKCLAFGYVSTCITVGATTCFVAEGMYDNLIVFRGVDDWEDARKSLNMGLNTKYRGIFTVHRGFYEEWVKIQPPLDSFLATVSFDKPLLIAGHSMGGALAQLCGVYYADYFDHIKVYTFGSPRVGTSSWIQFVKKYSEKYDLQVFNFINLSDIITTLPPRLLGWRSVNPVHIGKRKWMEFLFSTKGLAHKISRYKRSILLTLHGRM